MSEPKKPKKPKTGKTASTAKHADAPAPAKKPPNKDAGSAATNVGKVDAQDKPRSDAKPGTSAGTKLGALVGIVAAMVLAVLVNVMVARHYKRFDFTKGGVYTLSPATVETLRSLGEPIRVDVLLPSQDPLSLSARHLLEAYGSETTRLDIHYTDPDRHAAEFLALQRKYDDRVIDGRTIEDAAVVISRGDRASFVARRDLLEVDDENDVRARPRLEQSITAAIRAVITTDKPKVCFSTGHGEKSIAEGGSGLAALRDRLLKNGNEVVAIPTARELADDKERARAPYEGCRVVVLAGPNEKFSDEDAQKLDAFVETGGSVFIAAGPVPDEGDQRYLDLGLGPVLSHFGVSLDKDFVFEVDSHLRSTQGFGETFLPIPKAHPITEGLMRSEQAGLGAVLTVASSMRKTGAGSAVVSPLLVTSDEAFGMVDFFKWAKNPSEPVANDTDHKGPLTVAFASELPKKPGKERGSRFVIVSSSSPMMGENWSSDELRGTAIFVESSLAWLASVPTPLDIPNKPAFTAGLRLSEGSLASIFRYVVVFIPLASVLTGIAIHLRRRTTERKGGAKESK